MRRLLTNCPNLRILATSREALEVSGEALYPLLPLTYPKRQSPLDIDLLKDYETVLLFLDRARLVRPDFQLTPENAPFITKIGQQAECKSYISWEIFMRWKRYSRTFWINAKIHILLLTLYFCACWVLLGSAREITLGQ